ncbi:MAG: sulfatase [Phycisphaeraceae bacterium]|nr:sulfatase [Phycisphaeraceae bacterium]
MATRQSTSSRKPNILLIAIDSLRRDHMSLYGYPRNTTPHIDRFAEEATVFENTFSTHIPTTSAYASMLTGADCFTNQVVALRHKGGLTPKVKTLPEIARANGYLTTCVGFTGNPASRGFDQYLDYPGWGSWDQGRSPKAEELNKVAIPQLQRLCRQKKPWFVMLRHMDPHSPYLPPAPYERMFYHGNERDPKNKSLDTLYAFKPFADYFRTWFPPGCTDIQYINAQYDGAVAYMDACIQSIFTALDTLGVLDDTIVVLNGDHGETLDEHDCWFDHHGLYDPTLVVPLLIRYPKKLPVGIRVAGYNQHKDLLPTLVELADLKLDAATNKQIDGQTLTRLVFGPEVSFGSEFYITECTWMRKHGWRTPQWKLIVALEPDFHYKPPVELYNLIEDPLELNNLADREPAVVAALRKRMDQYIAQREKARRTTNPMLTQGDWSKGGAPFKTSKAAYQSLHIGDPKLAAKLQSEARK